MSSVPPGVGRRVVNTSNIMKTRRKNICEALRNSGNLERATKLLRASLAWRARCRPEFSRRIAQPRRRILILARRRIGAHGFNQIETEPTGTAVTVQKRRRLNEIGRAHV